MRFQHTDCQCSKVFYATKIGLVPIEKEVVTIQCPAQLNPIGFGVTTKKAK